jgi:hypothetical protein
MESPVNLRLDEALEAEPEAMTEDSIPLSESWLSIVSDPSLLLFYALESRESEMLVKAKFFRYIGNTMTMPYPQNDS